MKLLFDENLSPKLPRLLANLYPSSVHARDCGLLGGTDTALWEFARDQGYCLVSKDSDFQQRSLLYGHPPKFIWLRIGNCSLLQLKDLLTFHHLEIHKFEIDPLTSILSIS
ncbi:MAG: DUF5615 family PIN-like protein [Pirellulales bacterium]|nr:DUF5615 family PIN-like protein [Pirellulales bacterium]